MAHAAFRLTRRGQPHRQYFIARAREHAQAARRWLPDEHLAWLDEETPLFRDYIEAVGWAQDYARTNRRLMLDALAASVRAVLGRDFESAREAVDCHHNYSARAGEPGIIPGSMGARSFIVRGLGNAASYESCSHGAGRRMSRGEARRTFTLEDHARATADVECRKDAGVLDETPGAYKDIDAVMAAQSDLVEITTTLRQVVSVKG